LYHDLSPEISIGACFALKYFSIRDFGIFAEHVLSLIGRQDRKMKGEACGLLPISDPPTGQHAHQVGKTAREGGDVRAGSS
jgi:hypothetical protein